MTTYTFQSVTSIRPVPMSSKGGGTCLMACLASLMQIDHDDVFDLYAVFEKSHDYSWWDALKEWCTSRGYGLYWVNAEDTNKWPLPDGYYMEGWQWHGECNWHVVIARDGKVVHDPDGGRGPSPDYVAGYFIVEPLREDPDSG